jgi:hypothetical protein
VVATRGAFRASAAAPQRAKTPAGLVAQASQAGYRIAVSVTPNRSTALNRLTVQVTQHGHRVTGARVTVLVRMLQMAMAGIQEPLQPCPDGRYLNNQTTLGMIGRWGLRIAITPPHGTPFSTQIVDQVHS